MIQLILSLQTKIESNGKARKVEACVGHVHVGRRSEVKPKGGRRELKGEMILEGNTRKALKKILGSTVYNLVTKIVQPPK